LPQYATAFNAIIDLAVNIHYHTFSPVWAIQNSALGNTLKSGPNYISIVCCCCGGSHVVPFRLSFRPTPPLVAPPAGSAGLTFYLDCFAFSTFLRFPTANCVQFWLHEKKYDIKR